MVGDPDKHDTKFKVEEYEEFYQHHQFQPVSNEEAIAAHRIFPRVGWALDIAKEISEKQFYEQKNGTWEGKILDLGCLEGYTVLTLVNQLELGGFAPTGVGVDLSQEGIDIARQHAKKNNLPVKFFKDSLENWLENTDEKFDLITLFEIMEHVKDPVYVLKLVDKVLAPSGTVLISTPDFEAPTYGKDDEKNKCHIRLYTIADEDYEATNKYGTLRKATSITKQIGKDRIKELDVVSELINCRYE